ncbi:MAG: hypothetical protein HQL42_17615 [Alphaproteobacteria bacterium]|nr:hypothetical protein [Alphaproteobacteria bacterium]
MTNPRVSLSMFEMSDEELVALRRAADQELYRREIHRRAAQLIQEDLRAANRREGAESQRVVEDRLRLEGAANRAGRAQPPTEPDNRSGDAKPRPAAGVAVRH